MHAQIIVLIFKILARHILSLLMLFQPSCHNSISTLIIVLEPSWNNAQLGLLTRPQPRSDVAHVHAEVGPEDMWNYDRETVFCLQAHDTQIIIIE